MRNTKRFVYAFRAAFLFLPLSTVSLVFLPVHEIPQNLRYLLAGVFWVSLLSEVILLTMVNQFRKKTGDLKKESQKRFRVGIICFFSNLEASAADIILILSAVLMLLVVLSQWGGAWLFAITLSVLYAAVQLHCILNGINYRSYKLSHKIIKKGTKQK